MRLLFIFLTFFLPLLLKAQKQPTKLEKMFSQADTVYFVQHQITAGVGMVDKETGKEITFPPQFINGKPNYSIWIKSKVLRDTSLKRLAKILSRPYKNNSTEVETCKCIFAPTHTVFVIKGNQTAYFSFGFTSTKLKASDDFPLEEFDARRWEELHSFCEEQEMWIKQKVGLETTDSCNNAVLFENVPAAEAMVAKNYSGELKNYRGGDKTKLDFIHRFQNGKLIASTFYFKNGQPQEEYTFLCGALHGLQKFYHENGTLAKVIPYRYGRTNGIGQLYDKKGILRQEVTLVNGSAVLIVNYDSLGNRIQQ
jgi:hypothetical protein